MARTLLALLALVALLATPALADEWGYDPIGKRDPFRGPLHGTGPTVEGPVGSLFATWGLDQLRLVAVAGGDGERFAMVEPPQGPGALLRIGSVVGREAAVVTLIGERVVVAVQERRLPDGGLLVVEHPMTMPAEIGLPEPAPGP